MTENELTTENTNTALATADDIKSLLSQQSKYASPTALSEVTKVGDWLPYIQLMSSNSTQVKRGEFPMGNFALCKNRQLHDLGDKVIMGLLGWRPKAMQFAPEVISVFDTESEAFKKLHHRADTVKPNPGCGYGPEFLVWLPEVKELATYFLSNKTGRNESVNLISLIEKGVFLCYQESHLIDDGEYTWHGPRTLPCDLEVELPPADLLRKEVEKFNNPEAIQQQKEPAEEAKEEDSRSQMRGGDAAYSLTL